MDTTPVSLLERLRRPDEHEAWRRFVVLYTPMIYRLGRRVGLQDDDAADLVQEVFVLLLAKLPEFRYDPAQSFRSWLRTVTLNKWRERQRRRVPATPGEEHVAMAQFAAPEDGNTFEDREYRTYVVGRALKLMRDEFEPATWRACWDTVVGGRPATDVARKLGITENAVYIAKSRVLRRLRQELAGLLD